MAFERLNEQEWILLEKMVRTGKSLRGRPPKHHRQIFEAIFWLASCDVPWRSLPERFGKWNTVYRQFKRWSEGDLWQRVLSEVEGDPVVLENSQGLRQNILSTIRLAEQRHGQKPPSTSTSKHTGGHSSSDKSTHSTSSRNTLEAGSINL